MAGLPAGKIVADASLLIGVAEGDSAATRFVPVLRRCVITSVNFGEVLYVLDGRAGIDPAETEHVFRATLGVLVESVGLAAARRYPRLKEIDADSRAAGRGGRRAKSLSLADMTCLAHAWETGLPVLTGDRHWAALRPHGLPVDVFDFRDSSVQA